MHVRSCVGKKFEEVSFELSYYEVFSAKRHERIPGKSLSVVYDLTLIYCTWQSSSASLSHRTRIRNVRQCRDRIVFIGLKLKTVQRVTVGLLRASWGQYEHVRVTMGSLRACNDASVYRDLHKHNFTGTLQLNALHWSTMSQWQYTAVGPASQGWVQQISCHNMHNTVTILRIKEREYNKINLNTYLYVHTYIRSYVLINMAVTCLKGAFRHSDQIKR